MDSLSLSPLTLFMQAGVVGKIVMAVLALASVWCWVLIIEAWFGLRRLSAALAHERAGAGSDLMQAIDRAGQEEAQLQEAGESVSEKRKRVAEAIFVSSRSAIAKASGGLSNLAVISSVSPFIGLFGTVWGIMGSFAGIAAAKDTSLAVVAPGIAEALAATAYGLAAAIPAAIGYNRLGASYTKLGQAMAIRADARAKALIRKPVSGSKAGAS